MAAVVQMREAWAFCVGLQNPGYAKPLEVVHQVLREAGAKDSLWSNHYLSWRLLNSDVPELVDPTHVAGFQPHAKRRSSRKQGALLASGRPCITWWCLLPRPQLAKDFGLRTSEPWCLFLPANMFIHIVSPRIHSYRH